VKGLAALVAAAVLMLMPSVALAHRSHGTSQETNWQERDAAAYVVSTVNLLRMPHHVSFSSVAKQRLHVESYAVMSDTWRTNLYFIRLRRGDDSVAGALAYQMGWPAPRSVTTSVRKLGVARAPADIIASYTWDPKRTIGTFSSTLPG